MIIGGAGVDTITGGAGNDVLTGGADNDTFNVDADSDTITDLTTGDILKVSVGATATANNVSAFVATAASDNDGTATINSAAGGSTIDLALEAGSVGYTVVGGAGIDSITGTSRADSLSGNGGADTINAGGGNDTITGGSGADAINAGSGTNIVTDAGDGADTITHNSAASTVTIAVTGTGTVTLTASQAGATTNSSAGVNTTVNASTSTAAVTLNGNTGADTLTGGSGADTISGGAGRDVIVTGNGADSILAGDGADIVTVGTGSQVTTVDANVIVNLGDGNDRLWIEIDDLTSGDTLAGSTHSAGSASIQFNGDNDRVLATAHGLSNGDSLFFTSIVQATGVSAGIRYFVVNATTDDFQLSTTAGGSAVNVVNTDPDPYILGTGSYTVVTDTLEFITRGTVADLDFTNVTEIEYLFLASGGNTVTLGSEAYAGGAGIEYIVSGTGNDNIRFDDLTDLQRADITFNLRSGGQDTITIADAAGVRGLGQVASGVSLNATVSTWNTTVAGNDNVGPNTAATIIGFSGGDNGDLFNISGSFGVTIGSFAENVKLTTNNLSGLSVNSVIEISSNTSDGGFQLSNPLNLGAVATQLDTLNNLQDGTYFILIYNGSGSGADAYLYRATATEGDGLDFALNAPMNTDQDTLELIAQFVDVGGDALTSSNFI